MEDIYKELNRSATNGDLSHAYIFVSTNDGARNLLLNQITRSLLCEKQQIIGSHCEECNVCRAGKEHLDHLAICITPDKGKTKIGIDSIHKALLRVQLGNGEGWNVVLLSDLSAITREASAALLKTLEEPPLRTKFIFGARSVEDVLPTIRSRSVVIHVEKNETKEGIEIPKTFEQAMLLRDKYTKDRIGANRFLGALIKEAEQNIANDDVEKERLVFCLSELAAMREDISKTTCNVGLALDRALFACNGILFINES